MGVLPPLHILLYLLTGVGSGLAAGLMGVGGGLVNVPALYYVFQAAGYPADQCFHLALGTSLAIIVVTSSSAAWTHRASGNLIGRVSIVAGFGGIAGSLVASLLAVQTPDNMIKKAFALLLFAAAFRLVRRKDKTFTASAGLRLETWRLAMIGLASGVLAGFFGIGGGLVGVPMFILWVGLPPHKAIGSSSGMVVILGAFGALGYLISSPPQPMDFSLGYVNFPAWILVAGSSILFAHLGARIATRTSPRKLTILFACGLILVAVKMLIS